MNTKKIISLVLLISLTLVNLNYVKAEIAYPDYDVSHFLVYRGTSLLENANIELEDGEEKAEPGFRVYYLDKNNAKHRIPNENFNYYFSNNDKPGKASLTIKGISPFYGEKTVYFNVLGHKTQTQKNVTISDFMIINGSRTFGYLKDTFGSILDATSQTFPYIGCEMKTKKAWKKEGGSKKTLDKHYRIFNATLNNLNNLILNDSWKNNCIFSSENKKIFTVKNNKKMVLKNPGITYLKITNKSTNEIVKVKVYYFPSYDKNHVADKKTKCKILVKVKKKYTFIKFITKLKDKNLYYSIDINDKLYKSKSNDNIIKIKTKKIINKEIDSAEPLVDQKDHPIDKKDTKESHYFKYPMISGDFEFWNSDYSIVLNKKQINKIKKKHKYVNLLNKKYFK